MFDRGKQLEGLRPHPQGAAGRSVKVGIIAGQFQVGEFPEMRVHHAGGSLADEEEAAFLGDEGNKAARRGADAPAEAGQFVDVVLLVCDAMFRDRTDPASGLPWRADERAEFHERLVELSTAA